MKAAWFTDIHLDCVTDPELHVKNISTQSSGCDIVLISGDISVSHSLTQHLCLLEDALEKPIYFVLGNHDFYFSNISGVRKNVSALCNKLSYSRYLSCVPYIKFGKQTAIVGHDGWYDAGNGNAEISSFIMNDWIRISDFRPAMSPTGSGRIQISKDQIVQIAKSICYPAVAHISTGIKSSIQSGCNNVIVVTHVPPFEQSFVYNPKKGVHAIDAVPWYTSKMMGNMLLSAARACPNVNFTVISGHTHSAFDEKITDNLTAKVGAADYGNPSLAGFLNI